MYDFSEDKRPCPFTAMADATGNSTAVNMLARCFYVTHGGDWKQTFACMRLLHDLDLRCLTLRTYLDGYFFEAWDSDGESEPDCVRLQELASEYLYPTKAKP